jgi:Fe-S cluster assembly protein SufB
LNEGVVRWISARKGEPEWLTEWRLAAYRHFLQMPMPDWAKLEIAPIDLQAISYFAAPKQQYASLDEVDPKLLETYDKLGVPLHERARLAGVAVDAVFDSVSVGTTFRKELAEKGVIFCSFSEAVKEHPELVRCTWAAWCRRATTTSPRSIRRCSPTAASCTCRRACAARWS